MKLAFSVTDSATAEEVGLIGDNLAAFNVREVGPSEMKALAVLVRDDKGEVKAGIDAYTAWGWLYVQWLWVDESLRGQGVAGKMLDAAEAEARARGCHAAWIDTFNPVAQRVYSRHGYSVFGELPDFVKGRTRTFLQKRL
jgi:GNAT superfamily N-acetyltransferase